MEKLYLVFQGLVSVVVLYAFYIVVSTTLEMNSFETKLEQKLDASMHRARNIRFTSNKQTDLKGWKDNQVNSNREVKDVPTKLDLDLKKWDELSRQGN